MEPTFNLNCQVQLEVSRRSNKCACMMPKSIDMEGIIASMLRYAPYLSISLFLKKVKSFLIFVSLYVFHTITLGVAILSPSITGVWPLLQLPPSSNRLRGKSRNGHCLVEKSLTCFYLDYGSFGPIF